MSGFTTGLTSLRKRTPLPQRNLSLNESLLIKTEVNQLERQRDDLREDVKNLVLERNRDFKLISKEISALKKQKLGLINQIKRLTAIFSVFKGAQEKGLVSFEQFFSEREGFLVDFASAVSSRLAEKAQTLRERWRRLVQEENLIIEMTTYATSALEALSSALSEVAEAENRAENARAEALRQKEVAEAMLKDAFESLTLSQNRLGEADGLLAKAREKEKEVNEYAKRVTRATDNKTRKINLFSLEMLKKEERFRYWEAELKEKERLIKDRDSALDRKAEDIENMKSVPNVV